ncbi:MAG: MipA family protein [Sphingomonadales bacterium]|jgi:outer membrane scaffolding protein for murein synthesis (MipA/OmpV family)|nr:MipA family protein [Sphingomonadales bacterium]
MNRSPGVAALAFALILAPWSVSSAAAEDGGKKPPRRIRVGLGAQIVPAYPGADGHSLRPLVDVSLSRGSKPFAFEAPDESFGPSLIKEGGLEIGPALNFQGSRTAKDVGAALDKVPFTVEAGAFVQYAFGPKFRVRTELRKGLGGHDGLIGQAGADFVARDGDDWLFSIGPRVTVSDGRYHRAYFGVTAPEALRTGLAAYRPGGGVQALGATAGFLKQLNRRFGLYSYAKYDRLIGDAARSPVVRTYGSRDQLSAGLALTYTFGGGTK